MPGHAVVAALKKKKRLSVDKSLILAHNEHRVRIPVKRLNASSLVLSNKESNARIKADDGEEKKSPRKRARSEVKSPAKNQVKKPKKEEKKKVLQQSPSKKATPKKETPKKRKKSAPVSPASSSDSDAEEPPRKKGKWAKKKVELKLSANILDKLTQEQRGRLESCSIADMKAKLKLNDCVVGGTKTDLQLRIADNILNGVPPRCPTCCLGHLKKSAYGGFFCPGGYDDDVFCPCDYTGAKVDTVPWKKSENDVI